MDFINIIADILKGFLRLKPEMKRWWILKLTTIGVIAFTAIDVLVPGFGIIFGVSRPAALLILILACAIDFCLAILGKTKV